MAWKRNGEHQPKRLVDIESRSPCKGCPPKGPQLKFMVKWQKVWFGQAMGQFNLPTAPEFVGRLVQQQHAHSSGLGTGLVPLDEFS